MQVLLSQLLFVFICMEYLFPSPHFDSVCIQSLSEPLEDITYMDPSFGDIHPVTLCLFIGAFSAFIITVIIYSYILIAILLIALLVVFVVLYLFIFVFQLSCYLMTIFSIMIGFFSLSVCKSTIDFCHVITMRLICILDIYIGICVCVCVCVCVYTYIYMYMYNFKLLISRFKCILSILHLYSPPHYYCF